MSTNTAGEGAFSRGIIAFFVRHRNAHNLLMIMAVLAGLFSLRQLNTQFFPTVNLPAIVITAIWPGASAEDVEANVLEVIEPEVRFADDVTEVRAEAQEGFGSIFLEFDAGANMQEALSNIEAAVSRVAANLPNDLEDTRVQRVFFYEPIVSLILSGPFPEKTLKTYAKKIRDDLLDAGIDSIDFQGARSEEVWVEVPESTLRHFDMTLDTIAGRIRAFSEDVPSGTLNSRVDKQIRTLGITPEDDALKSVEVRALENGSKLLLGDIARVGSNFADGQPRGLSSGKSAVRINIKRAATTDTLKASAIVDSYLLRARQELPKTLNIEVFEKRADLVVQRIRMLTRNAMQGLILVVLILFVFLNARVAIWVALGIPIAVTSTFVFMQIMGLSINMLSLFGFLMMLGVIVDDAIVVGEHTASLRERGLGATEAAERGAKRMLAPVIASSLTTIAAFFPILLIGDVLGEFMRTLALIVIFVLIASLVECFLILPGHLHGALAKVSGSVAGARGRFQARFEAFRDGTFTRLIARAYDARYTTAALTLSTLVLCMGVIVGGRIGFSFFPSPEAETIHAKLVFVPGTPRAAVEAALLETEKALRTAEAQIVAAQGGAGFVKSVYAVSGSASGGAGSGGSTSSGSGGDNVGQVTVELTPAEARDIRTPVIQKAWQAAIPNFVGIDRVAILRDRAGPPGRDIDVRFEDAPIRALKAAALDLRKALESFPGVSAVEDNLPYGKPEIILEITPKGAALGFTAQEIGNQMRNAFQGRIAQRFVRGDEEIIVRVRLPQDDAGALPLSEMYLRAPNGTQESLTDIVRIRTHTGFARISRPNGTRQVSIVGDLKDDGASAGDVRRKLASDVLPDIAHKHGVRYKFAGQAEEQAEAFADLRLGLGLALVSIYVILAWIFGSYGRPFAIMSIIPFGLVGAILGHLIMGYDLSFLTMIALLGLSGILVNNSIVLVSQVEEYMREGKDLRTATIMGAGARLRAVLLTSITTCVGLAPLLFERSLQAQFLKPIAITLSFGVGVGALLVLFVVPAFLGIQHDAAARLKRVFSSPAQPA